MSKSSGILGAGVQLGFNASLSPTSTTLNGSISASVGTLTLTSATGYPATTGQSPFAGGAATPFLIVIGTEVIKVTTRVGTTCTVVRGWGGTTPAIHADLAPVSPGYTCLAQIENATPPKKTRDDVEISNHDSANRKKEFIPGWLDASAPTFTFIYLAPDALAVDAIVEAGTFYSWIFTYPDGHYETFRGYLKEAGMATPLKDKITRDVTIKIDDGSVTEH